MNVISASYSILTPDIDNPDIDSIICKQIERCGRTCYKSEKSITDTSGTRFVSNLIKNGHDAMIEHASMTVKFIVDRGISHELVRHRIASFAQESTRYCNYSQDKFGKEITVIEPYFAKDIPNDRKKEIIEYFNNVSSHLEINSLNAVEKCYAYWYSSCCVSELDYFSMLLMGATPQDARSVLPTSLKTEVVMTANMREWRHFLKLRAVGTTGAPHPQMLEVTVPLLNELKLKLPSLFGDLSKSEE